MASRPAALSIPCQPYFRARAQDRAGICATCTLRPMCTREGFYPVCRDGCGEILQPILAATQTTIAGRIVHQGDVVGFTCSCELEAMGADGAVPATVAS